MKAIQVKQTGGPEVMELADLPVPQPKPNEAVVNILAVGVNFIDVYNREGRYKVPLPFVLGQEGAGVVSAVGSEVRDVAIGDRGALSRLRHISTEEGRDRSNPRRCRRSGAVAGPDGAQHRRPRYRNRFDRRESRVGARSWSRRDHFLYAI